LYSLGSDPSVIGQKRWKEVHPLLINGAVISAATIGGGGINLAQRPGNSWFVAKEGNARVKYTLDKQDYPMHSS
jgi:hypothetical protein